jgi:CubicO group peptidase (beta-lactamase class C family)
MSKNVMVCLALGLIATGTMPSLVTGADDKVDAYVADQMAEQKIPGLALLVTKDGNTIKAQGYGLANLEHNVPVTPETIFQSGSMGKQFTATAVMLLVEDGKLKLDDRIVTYLTDAPDSWQPITIRQLLSHTAGVGDFSPLFDLRREYSEEKLLNIIYKIPLRFTPGERWEYSNPGYITLGILIGRVTGKHYGEFLQERIFKPLGMQSTRIISEADIIPHRAAGYRLVKGELKNQTYVSASLNTTADGSLYTNILDLAKWDFVLRGEPPLKRSLLDQMWTPVMLANGQPNPVRYGFGWMTKPYRGHRVVEHGGAWQGFTTHIARFLDDDLSIVVLTNLSADSGVKPVTIVRGIAGLYVPELAPKVEPLREDAREALSKLVAERITSYLAEKGDPEDYADEAREVLFSEAAKPIRHQLAGLGPWKLFEHVQSHLEDGDKVGECVATYAGGVAVIYRFRINAQNKIAEISVDFK